MTPRHVTVTPRPRPGEWALMGMAERRIAHIVDETGHSSICGRAGGYVFPCRYPWQRCKLCQHKAPA